MNLRYMLDTDSVSFALRGLGNVSQRLLAHKPSEICMSSITLSELRYGAELRHSDKLNHLIEEFAQAIAVMPFDTSSAVQFGRTASDLTRKGLPIGNFDTLIAAHALSLHLILVTNNTKHFRNVPGLEIENWF